MTPDTPYSPPLTPVTGKPDNSLILAIFSTLCCCVPTGIAAIVFAAQVDTKWSAGDIVGAQESAAKARLWSWVSIGVGLVGAVVYVLAGLATGHTDFQA